MGSRETKHVGEALTVSEIDPRDLRKALGAFMTGVTVVTTLDGDGAPRGLTANSFTSVSLDPPLVLFCIAKTAATCPVFTAAAQFAVNILTEDQREVSSTFASRVEDRFATGDWRPGETGSPVLAGAAAWLDCRMHDQVDAGDHLILIGRVVAYEYSSANPLGYFRGNYISSRLEQEAVDASGATTRVGAILEHDGSVLLIEDPETGALRPPRGDSVGRPEQPASLHGALAALGIEADVGFLYAVYEDQESGTLSVYYRGEIKEGAPGAAAPLEGRLFALEDIPWPRLADEALRIMLRRYVKERLEDRFSIYVGDQETGRVHPVAE